MSVLDGILPKDPQFGVLDGDMVSELLEKSENNVVVNGAVHHADTTKMNGDISGGKRLLGEYVDNSPAKKQALEAICIQYQNTFLIIRNKRKSALR